MTSPVSMPAGHKMVAADFDAYENATAVWTNYVPSWTNVTIGNAVVVARYRQVGKTVDVRAKATFGTTTAYGAGIIFVTLPIVGVDTAVCGVAVVADGGAQRSGAAFMSSTNTVVVVVASTLVATPATPFTWSTGDEFAFSITYEAA